MSKTFTIETTNRCNDIQAVFEVRLLAVRDITEGFPGEEIIDDLDNDNRDEILEDCLAWIRDNPNKTDNRL